VGEAPVGVSRRQPVLTKSEKLKLIAAVKREVRKLPNLPKDAGLKVQVVGYADKYLQVTVTTRAYTKRSRKRQQLRKDVLDISFRLATEAHIERGSVWVEASKKKSSTGS
jgi:hypothetical protein